MPTRRASRRSHKSCTPARTVRADTECGGLRNATAKPRADAPPPLPLLLLSPVPPAVLERHRHRYEVNPHNVRALVDAGLVFSGTDEGGQRMETVELPADIHPFFFAAQYHPEFLTRPDRPSPPFHGLLSAASGQGVPEGPAAAAMKAFETLTAAGKQLPKFKMPTAPHRSPTTSPAGAGAGAGAGAEDGGLERAMSMASIDEVAVKLNVMTATKLVTAESKLQPTATN